MSKNLNRQKGFVTEEEIGLILVMLMILGCIILILFFGSRAMTESIVNLSNKEYALRINNCVKRAVMLNETGYIPLYSEKKNRSLGPSDEKKNLDFIQQVLEEFQKKQNVKITSWNFYEDNGKFLRGLNVTFKKLPEKCGPEEPAVKKEGKADEKEAD